MTIESLGDEFKKMLIDDNKSVGDYCILLVSTSRSRGQVIHNAYKSVDDFLKYAQSNSDQIDLMFDVGFDLVYFE